MKDRKPLPPTFTEEVPAITVTKNKLRIEIGLPELMFVIENNIDNPFKVNKPKELLKAFKKHLERYATGNAVEKGITDLQQLFDDITEQVYTNEEDILIEVNEQ